jgi:hypothetical protein
VSDDAVELEKSYQFAVAIKMNKHMFFRYTPKIYKKKAETMRELEASFQTI